MNRTLLISPNKHIYQKNILANFQDSGTLLCLRFYQKKKNVIDCIIFSEFLVIFSDYMHRI